MNWFWHVVIVVLASVAGVVLRPYLLSDWGPFAFILAAGLAIAIAASWRGAGKPWSPIFGSLCGIAFAIVLTVTFFTNVWGGFAAIAALFYLGFKTKVLDRF